MTEPLPQTPEERASKAEAAAAERAAELKKEREERAAEKAAHAAELAAARTPKPAPPKEDDGARPGWL